MNYSSPPLREYRSAEPDNPFPIWAAVASFVAPLASICLIFLAERAFRSNPTPQIKVAIMGLIIACMVLFCAGIIFAIAALARVQSGNRTPVIIFSVLGLILNVGIVGSVVVLGIQRVQARQQANRNIVEAGQEVRDRSIAALRAGTNQPVDFDPLKKALDDASKTGTAGDKLAYQGLQNYLLKIQALQSNYNDVVMNMREANVLAVSNLVMRSTISDRRALVQRFLDANDTIKDFVDHSGDHFREELVAVKTPPSVIDSAMPGFERVQVRERPVIDRIRGDDDQYGQTLLGVLDLLDTSWGRWRYSTTTHRLTFENADALNKYNAYQQQLRTIARDQATAQQQLANIMQQAQLPTGQQ